MSFGNKKIYKWYVDGDGMMKKQEYIKRYLEKLERKLNKTIDAYALYEYTNCEYCPFDEDGCDCVGCVETLGSNIDDINEVI